MIMQFSNTILSLLTVVIIMLLAVGIGFFFDFDNLVIIMFLYGMLTIFLYLWGVISFGHGAIGFIVIAVMVYIVSRRQEY